MSGDVLDLLCKTTNEMRHFLRCARQSAERPVAVDASLVKSLAGRLRQVGEAIRAASPSEVARARASSVYGEYKDLLGEVQSVLRPLHDQLAARQAELDVSRSQVEAVRSWTAAYERTR